MARVHRILVSTLLLVPVLARASGGDYALADFVEQSGPAAPQTFYAGQLGIVLPDYGVRYLAVAYRWLSGLDVTAEEAKRLSPYPADVEHERSGFGPLQAWKAARLSLGLQDVEIDADVERGPYEFLPNCAGDAFRRATTRLNELVAAHGAESADLREWVAGQDAVFATCSGEGDLPSEVAETAPQWLREERDYQKAAVLYYRGDYTAAAASFGALAAREQSSLAPLAGYLVARASVRSAEQEIGSPAEGSEPVQDEAAAARYRSAVASISALTAPDSNHAYRLAALQLHGHLEAAIHPQARALALDEALRAPRLSENAWQDVWDYANLAPAWAPEATIFRWIGNFGAGDSAGAFPLARAEWEKTGRIAWLLSALHHAAGGDRGEVADLLQRAAAVPRTSPAWLSVGYYRAQALRAIGRDKEARELIKQLLAERQMDGSARNLLLDQAALLAESGAAFASVAMQRPVTIGYPGSENGPEGTMERWRADPDLNWRQEVLSGNPAYFSYDVADAMNRAMPFESLQGLLGQTWPAHVRRALLTTLWARGVLLERTDDLVPLARELREHFPKSSQLLNDFANEGDEERRRFLAAVFLLRTPGANPLIEGGLGRSSPPEVIGLQDTRWWNLYALCAVRSDCGEPSHVTPKPVPLFLAGAPMEAAQEELGQMYAQGAVTTFAGKIVLGHARANGADAWVPEALHLVVRASRYGDNDCASGEVSKQAFGLLHARYKGNRWQKETPNWYEKDWGCNGESLTEGGGKRQTVWLASGLGFGGVLALGGGYVWRRRRRRPKPA